MNFHDKKLRASLAQEKTPNNKMDCFVFLPILTGKEAYIIMLRYKVWYIQEINTEQSGKLSLFSLICAGIEPLILMLIDKGSR